MTTVPIMLDAVEYLKDHNREALLDTVQDWIDATWTPIPLEDIDLYARAASAMLTVASDYGVVDLDTAENLMFVVERLARRIYEAKGMDLDTAWAAIREERRNRTSQDVDPWRRGETMPCD